MNKKNKKNIKKFIVIIIFVLVVIFVSVNNFIQNKKCDDIIFLKFLSDRKIPNKEYLFNVSYKDTQIKTIDLSEKIFPGSNGNFDIILESNKKSKYIIKFKSTTDKPNNLKFKAIINSKFVAEENTLEELSKKLEGYIDNDETIKITIYWLWEYNHQTLEEDIQDTKDAQYIKNYQFDLYVTGEEI